MSEYKPATMIARTAILARHSARLLFKKQWYRKMAKIAYSVQWADFRKRKCSVAKVLGVTLT